MTSLFNSERMQLSTPTSASRVERSALVQSALELLLAAAKNRQEALLQIEERAVYQPDSWLLQKCWEALADVGAGTEALTVAHMAAPRQPLAPVQTLYRLSRQIDRKLGLANLIRQELASLHPRLMAPEMLREPPERESAPVREQLLYAAATAAAIGEVQQALTLLERLDQFTEPWERPIVMPEQRQMLGETIVKLPPHPLTVALIAHALRRYGDAGAQFVLAVTTAAGEHLRASPGASRPARLLKHGVNAFRHTSLTSLHARRLTAVALAQAGASGEVLSQLTAIANIQAARRESGLSLRKADQNVLRQVKRPTADADVDFLVYTIQEAVRAMPVRSMPREHRIELANRLVLLGAKSDGWTAAGAASTLVELGAIKYAVEVVEAIPAGDPTKAEGYIGLVRGLLAVDEPELAQEQIAKGLAWVRSYPGRNPARALIWGLAELFLERREPAQALAILDAWEEPGGFWRPLRTRFGRKWSDDDLRNQGLRLRALLQQDALSPKATQQRLNALLTWAPRLLDGEALFNFLTENLLAPLLAAGRVEQALSVLPLYRQAMRGGSGEKHASRLAGLSRLLASELGTLLHMPVAGTSNGGNSTARSALEAFLLGVWQADSQRSLWHTVHGVEGTLPLLIALDGPEAVVALAKGIVQSGKQWSES
ncbi:MAG: hypothetical protein NZ553_06675 [Caldilinea sp.]|nr:hypothetical protein [Caldilinea sp.]MDW8440136.1 hypothetical protein [Caldilineaceae bacterium]